MPAVNVQSLIEYFCKELKENDRTRMRDISGKTPEYPLLVVYVGEDAKSGHATLADELLQVWPQFHNEIQFLAVNENSGELEYNRFTDLKDDSALEKVDDPAELLIGLFDEHTHFRSRNVVMIYYIVSTSSFRTVESMENCFVTLGKIKEDFGGSHVPSFDMLFLLLNEDFIHQSVANDIRNLLCKNRSEIPGNDLNCICLLSNRRDGNTIIKDNSVRYNIIANVIMLSDNEDTDIVENIFGNGRGSGPVNMITAAYAREEKPFAEIGYVIADRLVTRYSAKREENSPNGTLSENFNEKLGIDKYGCIETLNKYADDVLVSRLPDENMLELFPRADDEEHGLLANMTADQFNNFTMGAWEQKLKAICSSEANRIADSSEIREQLVSDYFNDYVSQKCTGKELIYIAEHIPEIRERIKGQIRSVNEVNGVLAEAKNRLHRTFTSDDRILDIMLNGLCMKAQKSKELNEVIDELVLSRRDVHPNKDETITKYYSVIMRNYFDKNGLNADNRFEKVTDAEELEMFLHSQIDRIIESDKAFSMGFEDELEERLTGIEGETDSKQLIRRKLSDDDLHVYLQTNFPLSSPMVSAILQKTGTSLHDYLQDSLSKETYYYNTGTGSTAAAIKIYAVETNMIING